MFFQMASARLVGNLTEYLIAEGKALFRIGLFPQRLLKHLGHKEAYRLGCSSGSIFPKTVLNSGR